MGIRYSKTKTPAIVVAQPFCQIEWSDDIGRPEEMVCLYKGCTNFPQSNIDDEVERAMEYGKRVKHLKLIVSRPNTMMARIFVSNFDKFIGGLVEGNCQLKSFVFKYMYADSYWKRENVRHSFGIILCNFFLGQKELQEFDMCEACLNEDNGLRVLQLISQCTRTSTVFKIMRIVNFFTLKTPVAEIKFFKELIPTFAHLEELALNHSYLSDEVLNLLGDTCKGTLATLQVHAEESDIHDNVLSSDAWRKIKVECAKLEVTYKISCIGTHNEVVGILTEGIPLHKIDIFTGAYDSQKKWNIAATMEYIGVTFGTYLEYAVLTIEPGGYSTDSLAIGLFAFLQKCKKLLMCELSGNFSLHCMNELCKMRLRNEIKVAYLMVWLYEKSDTEQVCIDEMEKRYATDLSKLHAFFEFQRGTSALADADRKLAWNRKVNY